MNLELTAAPPPPLLFVFVLFPERTTPKYGERGGRFQLIEVGRASQNLALRLSGTAARVALGYACGHPVRLSRREPAGR